MRNLESEGEYKHRMRKAAKELLQGAASGRMARSEEPYELAAAAGAEQSGEAAPEATAARQEQASAEERERWAMRVAEVEARAADAEARAAVACECARAWQVVAERRQRKCWTWAAWEKKQAAYSIWERERHAETMRRELGSDSDD